ncbi:hypothetical protein R1sor_014433 [Riccia sorocarpa]|uniref:SET domain-containing protein n=1 Tax=Riccia sorocarpa TaxID=122646 RepID=A0ABD3HC90_9MARC
MTKTAVEAARHIQQWGRHDEGESSRAASDRRGEVQSRSRPAIRDILRHRFIQFSKTAIQDFSTQLRTNRALPPPDLAKHAQPEPKVEPEVEPVVHPVVEPEVEHIMEPTASVESHHPSTEVHGVVGESIVVVEGYVAPHRDDDTSGCSRISPPPMTPPRTRRGRRGSQSLAADDSLVLHIPSRVVRRGIRLRGEAARIYREFDPASLEVPPSIPIGEEVSVWGRRWIVRQSTLGRYAGHGLFACEDILFDSAAPEETRPSLFPYVGSVYSHDEWLVLLGAHPTGFRTYLLDVDSWRGSIMTREEYRFVDGDPARCPNLAGYINSVIGTRRPQRQPNVMWVLIEDPPASYGRRDLEFHVATVPTRPIQAGEERLCDYPWGSGFPGSSCALVFEVYSRRHRETIQHAGMLRYESPTDPQIFEEHVTSSEDGDFDGLRDEEDAMADLFTEWFPPEPPTDGYHSDQLMDVEHRGVTMEDEDRRTKRRRAAAAREQQTAYEFSRTPIYPGAKCSRLSYTLLILNLQARFGCSNECISGIFKLLAEKVLPEGSDVPNCRPEAKKVLTAVGMDYEMIHACENDCILYRNEYNDSTSCPKCQTSRYRTDTQGKTIPRKVKSFTSLSKFPIIPRLRHMFRCRPLADMMTWHKEHGSDDGFMRLVVDSPAVQHVEQTCFGLCITILDMPKSSDFRHRGMQHVQRVGLLYQWQGVLICRNRFI